VDGTKWHFGFNSSRSMILAKPDTLNGESRSETNINGDLASRFKARNALNSSPSSGCVLVCPFLAIRRLKFHIAPLQAAQLKAMPECDEDHGRVTLTPAVIPGGLDEPIYLPLS
jgi:hypothetical protein